MGLFFKKATYTKNDLRLLEKEKRRLSMKHHPDKGGNQTDFVFMMREYEHIKSVIDEFGRYGKEEEVKTTDTHASKDVVKSEHTERPRKRTGFYSSKTTMEEDRQALKEHLKKMREAERAEKYSARRLGAYVFGVLSGSKVQMALLVVSFPLIFRLGLPYGIEGILVLFSIHTLIACLLGKNLLAFISIMTFSLEMKHYYEPFVPFEVWNTIGNTINFWIFGVIVSFIARVKPREEPMDWEGLWTKAKEKI